MEGQQLDGHAFDTPWGRRTIHATRLDHPDPVSSVRRICFRFIEEPARHYTLEICNEYIVEDMARVIAIVAALLRSGPENGSILRIDEWLFRGASTAG